MIRNILYQVLFKIHALSFHPNNLNWELLLYVHFTERDFKAGDRLGLKPWTI